MIVETKIKSFLLKLAKFYRIKDWIKNLGITAIGAELGDFNLFGFFYSIFLSIVCHAFIFSINNFCDLEFRKSKKNSENFIQYPYIFVIIPMIFAVLLSYFVSFTIFVIVLIILLLGTLYSAPPFRLKRYWPFSLTINGVSGSLFLLLGYYSTTNTFVVQLLIFSFAFFSFICSCEIIHQLAHKSVDKRDKIKSFPNVYGNKKSILLFQIIQVAAVLIYIISLFFDYQKNWIFIGSAFFSILRIIKISRINPYSTNFSALRNKLYGMWEGLYYLLSIFLSKQLFAYSF